MVGVGAGSRPDAPEGARLGVTFVKIKGMRLGRYVEFDFSVNDQDLTIELILPLSAFEEFCAWQNSTILPPEPETAAAIEQLAWRAGQPGLLRKVSRSAETAES